MTTTLRTAKFPVATTTKTKPAAKRSVPLPRGYWRALMAWSLCSLLVAAALVVATPSDARLSPGGHGERIELRALETRSG